MINPGNILIATPHVIGDIDFHRAVVLIVDSNKSTSELRTPALYIGTSGSDNPRNMKEIMTITIQL